MAGDPARATSSSAPVVLMSEGDSLSVRFADTHIARYADSHPGTIGNAVGASTICCHAGNSLVERFAADQLQHPTHLTVLIGANDMTTYLDVGPPAPAPTAWLNSLWSYTDAWRALGVKVAVGTLLSQCYPNNAVYNNAFNARRAIVNPAIRAAVGTHIDAVIDFAADPVMGGDMSSCDAAYFMDPVHPNPAGQLRMYNVYLPAVTGFIQSGGTISSPVPVNNDVVGAFRFICGAGTLNYDDPIVFFGQTGAAHGHQKFGRDMNANTTYAIARASGGSSCNNIAGQDNNVAKAGEAGNRTPYWVPFLLTGTGFVLQPDYFQVYYKREPATSAECTNVLRFPGGCAPIPRGLKQIFGNKHTDSSYVNPDAPPEFLCSNVNGGATVNYFTDMAGALACAKNQAVATGQPQNFIARLVSPDCWNGTTIDSADHRSHLAYQRNTGLGYFACPATHPVHIPFFLEAEVFTIQPTDNVTNYRFSSDDMDTSKPKGWSYHGDYGPMAWDPTILATWEANCINKKLSCQGGELGDGTMLKGAAVPYYLSGGTYTASFTNPNRLVPVP